MAKKNKVNALYARRKAQADQRKVNAAAFYREVEQLEKQIFKLADKARPPRRDDNDARLILDEVSLRRMTDAAFALRRVRDLR